MPTSAPASIWSPWAYIAGVAGLSLTVLVVVLVAGGGRPVPIPPGLPDPGPVTGWGLPVARLTTSLSGVLAAGMLLTAGVLLPAGKDGRLTRSGFRCLRTAVAAAGLCALVAAAQGVLALSDLLGVPPAEGVDLAQLRFFVGQTALGQALAIEALLAGVVALCAPWVVRPGGARLASVVALGAVAVPALAGHAAGSNEHLLAVGSLLVHVIAAAVWVGCLAGLVLVATRATGPLLTAVPRFSRLAWWCAAAVAGSGVVNALVRVGSIEELGGSAYGRLVLAKVAALGLLVALGWQHRRRTLPTLVGARARGAFLRLAAVELAVMAATVGLAVGLSRTPTPAPDETTAGGADGVGDLLGFAMPPQPTVARLLADGYADATALAFLCVAATLYLSGVRALRRRGDAWPVMRTAAWFGGLLAVAAVTVTGVGRYALVLFSAHMVQHMVLSMLAPMLLVLGAPVTLALRSLPSGGRHRLLRVLHSPPARVLAHPLVAAGIFVGSLYGLYFTPVFPAAMGSHLGHVAMQVHFLLAGGLFFWVIAGVDPGPRRPPYPLRVLLLFVVMAFHAFFSIALMSTTSVLASSYYSELARPWGDSLLADQRLGGAIGWAFGELPVVLVLIAVFVQWVRADERTARAGDRSMDRTAEAELASYNAYLRALARLDERRVDRAGPPHT